MKGLGKEWMKNYGIYNNMQLSQNELAASLIILNKDQTSF